MCKGRARQGAASRSVAAGSDGRHARSKLEGMGLFLCVQAAWPRLLSDAKVVGDAVLGRSGVLCFPPAATPALSVAPTLRRPQSRPQAQTAHCCSPQASLLLPQRVWHQPGALACQRPPPSAADPPAGLLATMHQSPFAGVGLPAFEEEAAPSPLEAFSQGAAGLVNARCGQGRPGSRPVGATAAAGRPAALRVRAAAGGSALAWSQLRPSPHSAPPPPAPTSARPVHRRSPAMDDECLLQAVVGAAPGLPSGGGGMAGMARSASIANPCDVAELLAQISLLSPAPMPAASLGSAGSLGAEGGCGPRALASGGGSRVQWIQPSGEQGACSKGPRPLCPARPCACAAHQRCPARRPCPQVHAAPARAPRMWSKGWWWPSPPPPAARCSGSTLLAAGFIVGARAGAGHRACCFRA